MTGSAACAAAVTALSGVLAAGLHHATAGSPVSWPGLFLAVAALFICCFSALRLGAWRTAAAVVVIGQTAMPTWLNAVEPTASPDGHRALPPVWHHSGPSMAVLYVSAALALAWLLHRAGAVPKQLILAWWGPARQWAARIAVILTGRTPLPTAPCCPWLRHAVVEATAPKTSQVVLRHEVVPCGP